MHERLLRRAHLRAKIRLKDFLQTLRRIDIHGKSHETLRVLRILIQEFKGAHGFRTSCTASAPLSVRKDDQRKKKATNPAILPASSTSEEARPGNQLPMRCVTPATLSTTRLGPPPCLHPQNTAMYIWCINGQQVVCEAQSHSQICQLFSCSRNLAPRPAYV